MIDIERYIYYSIFLIFLNLISIYFFLKVLKSGELSTYVPMLSFTPLFSALYSYIILGEELHQYQYLGMFFIITGSILMHSSNFKKKNLLASPINFIKSKNSLMIIIVSLIWSLTPVLDKECLKHTDLYLHGFLQSSGMLFVVFFFLYKNRLKVMKNHNIDRKFFLVFISLILISFLSAYFQLQALIFSLVAELESLKRSIGIVSSLLFGYYFFKEKISFFKIFSALIILSGVVKVIIFS